MGIKKANGFLKVVDTVFYGVLSWRKSGALLKDAAKMVLAGKTALFRNCGHSEWGVCKQLLGFLDTEIQNILSW